MDISAFGFVLYETIEVVKDWIQTHKTDNPKEYLKEQIDYWGYPTFEINETNIDKITLFETE